MNLEQNIDNLLEYVFTNKTLYIPRSELPSVEELIKNKVVITITDDDTKVRLNSTSKKLGERLFSEHEKSLKSVPNSITEVIEAVDEFKKTIRKKFTIENNNGFLRELVLSLAALHFSKLKSSGIDVLSFINEEAANNEYRNFKIFDPFIIHAINDDYELQEIYKYCQECAISNDGRIGRIIAILHSCRQDEILKLYEYGLSKDEFECCEFQLRIISIVFGLIGGQVLISIDDIYNRTPKKGLKLLSRLILSSKDVDKAISMAEKVINDFSLVEEQNELFEALISNPVSSVIQRKQVYGLWNHLLLKAPEEKCKLLISTIGFIQIVEDDSFKFTLLLNYINRCKDSDMVENFFKSFQSPSYMYEMLYRLCQGAEGRKYTILKLFRSSLVHFFRKDPVQSETLILEFFDLKYRLGTLPIDIMTLDLPDIFPVDLLKLETEELQIGSIRKFEYVSFEFDKLIPILIKLKDSKFPKVVSELQSLLKRLTFEVYGDLMVTWLNQHLGKDRKSKAFLKPITEAVEHRKLLMEKKFAIADLNPLHNETNLVELYLSLQKEAQDNSFSKAKSRPGFLMSFVKNTSIVRGNSWRHGGPNSKVSALSNFKSEFVIDNRVYKNPDLFEFQKKHFEE